MRTARRVLMAFILSCSVGCMFVPGQEYDTFTTPTPLPAGDVLIIGIHGGRDSWDDDRKGIRKLALALRDHDLGGVWIETIENKERELALELVTQALDHDRDGSLDDNERAGARIVVYGQSFGGAAVVKLARDLEALDVPIALTVQIDSVGRGDAEIPPNVTRAANLFQRSGWFVKGEKEIRAADPTRTVVIGNFEYDYSDSDISLDGVPWYKRAFRVAHARMDRDPAVWERVESLILDQLAEWGMDVPHSRDDVGKSDPQGS